MLLWFPAAWGTGRPGWSPDPVRRRHLDAEGPDWRSGPQAAEALSRRSPDTASSGSSPNLTSRSRTQHPSDWGRRMFRVVEFCAYTARPTWTGLHPIGAYFAARGMSTTDGVYEKLTFRRQAGVRSGRRQHPTMGFATRTRRGGTLIGTGYGVADRKELFNHLISAARGPSSTRAVLYWAWATGSTAPTTPSACATRWRAARAQTAAKRRQWARLAKAWVRGRREPGPPARNFQSRFTTKLPIPD